MTDLLLKIGNKDKTRPNDGTGINEEPLFRSNNTVSIQDPSVCMPTLRSNVY